MPAGSVTAGPPPGAREEELGLHTFWWPQKAARGQVGEVRVMRRELLAQDKEKLAGIPKHPPVE